MRDIVVTVLLSLLVLLTVKIGALPAEFDQNIINIKALTMLVGQDTSISVLSSPGTCLASELKTGVNHTEAWLESIPLNWSGPSSYVSAVLASSQGQCQYAWLRFRKDENGVPLRPTAALVLGSCWLEAGEEARALATWARADLAPFFLREAEDCVQGGDGAGAVQIMMLYEQTGVPYTFEAYALLGDGYRIQGMQQGAIAAYERALTLGESYGVLRDLGIALVGTREYELARHYLTKAISLAPHQSGALNVIGLSYEAQGRYDEAFAVYERLGDGKSGKALDGKGRVRLIQGRYADALTYYEELIPILTEQGKLHIDPLRRAIQAAVLSQQWHLARAWLEEAIVLVPQDISPRLDLADVCLQLDDLACTEAQYRAILQYDPANVDVSQHLKELLDGRR